MAKENETIFKKPVDQFDKTLQEYRESILEVIRVDAELESKVLRLEPLMRIIHSLIFSRASSEYKSKSKDLLIGLENGTYQEKSISLITDRRAKIFRYNILVAWYSMQIQEMPDLALHLDFSRVDFNALDKK